VLPPAPTATLAEIAQTLPDVTAAGGAVACFDADGTLWPGDVQEAILRALIAERRLLGVPYGERDAEDVFYEEYARLLRDAPAQAILRGMTLLAGLDAAEVDARAAEIVAREFAPNVYAEMVYFLGAVRELGYEPWIVSGTGERFVKMMAPVVGIDPARVIGLCTEVDARGRFGWQVEGDVPYGEGKVRCIAARIGRRPRLVAGNGRGDVEMLELAEGVALAVNPDPHLFERAGARGWPVVEVKRPEPRTLSGWAIPKAPPADAGGEEADGT
jgi:phosphoserine phosphatase